MSSLSWHQQELHLTPCWQSRLVLANVPGAHWSSKLFLSTSFLSGFPHMNHKVCAAGVLLNTLHSNSGFLHGDVLTNWVIFFQMRATFFSPSSCEGMKEAALTLRSLKSLNLIRHYCSIEYRGILGIICIHSVNSLSKISNPKQLIKIKGICGTCCVVLLSK